METYWLINFTHISEFVFVCVCVCVFGLCSWPMDKQNILQKRTDSTKKDLEQMFRWPQSHFLSAALDFFFPFLFSLMDAEWFVLFLWKPRLHERGKVIQAVDTAGTDQETACAVGLAVPYMFVSACHMCCLSLSVCLPLCWLSLDNQKSYPRREWHLGP